MRNRQKELLLQLRSKLVAALHTQPFTIYTDQTVEDLLNAQPKTMDELIKVKGFPKDGKRIKGFGEAIIQIFTCTEDIEQIEISASDLAVNVKTQQMRGF